MKRTPSEIADVTVLATKYIACALKGVTEADQLCRIQRTLDFERELIHQDEHPMLLESLADFTLARKLRMAELDLLQRSRQEARTKMIEYESRQNWLQWEDRKRALWTDMWRDLRSRERRLIAEVCDSDICKSTTDCADHKLILRESCTAVPDVAKRGSSCGVPAGQVTEAHHAAAY